MPGCKPRIFVIRSVRLKLRKKEKKETMQTMHRGSVVPASRPRFARWARGPLPSEAGCLGLGMAGRQWWTYNVHVM
jgi:hypothetical protein